MSRHVVIIENDARWPAQVWEHDGDEPIAIFQHAADAHLFNAAPDMAEVLLDLVKNPPGERRIDWLYRASVALTKAGIQL